jgi:hypothetical protein
VKALWVAMAALENMFAQFEQAIAKLTAYAEAQKQWAEALRQLAESK